MKNNKQIFAAAAAAALSLTMLPIHEAKAGWVTLTLRRNKEDPVCQNLLVSREKRLEAEDDLKKTQLIHYIYDLLDDDTLTDEERIQLILDKAEELNLSVDAEKELEDARSCPEDMYDWESVISEISEKISKDIENSSLKLP